MHCFSRFPSIPYRKIFHFSKKQNHQEVLHTFLANRNLIFKGNLILGVVPLNALSACAETPPQAPSILPLWACPRLTAAYIIPMNVLETEYLSNIDFWLNFVRENSSGDGLVVLAVGGIIKRDFFFFYTGEERRHQGQSELGTNNLLRHITFKLPVNNMQCKGP